MIAMKRILIILLMLLFVSALFPVMAHDSIMVKKDARLDVLTTKLSQMNKRASMLTSSGLYRGYRVQVLSTRTREDAFKAKSLLLTSFPEYKTYVMFQSPSFKVRIGNFIRKEDADKFRKQLAYFFPQGVYIVDDGIEYSPTEDEEIILQ